jgi:hypothetical protein
MVIFNALGKDVTRPKRRKIGESEDARTACEGILVS